MTFYPDGQPEIPNQTPIPGAESVAVSQPGDAAGQLYVRTIIRTAVLNGALLVLAVLAIYVFGWIKDPNVQVGVLVSVALFCMARTALVMVLARRRLQGAQARSAPGVATVQAPSPYKTATSPWPQDAPGGDATVAPYGAVASTSEFALTVEDVFTITGRGTVVTGRVAAGSVSEGQYVTLQRPGQPPRQLEVTGIEMFRRMTTTANQGDMVGLLLAGVTRDEIERGDQLLA